MPSERHSSACDATHRVRSEFREKHAAFLTFIGACGQSERDAQLRILKGLYSVMVHVLANVPGATGNGGPKCHSGGTLEVLR